MEMNFVRSWQALALRGLAGMAFGAAALVMPGVTLAAIVLLFGAYSLVDGVLAIAAGTRQHGRPYAWILGVEGALGVAVGLVVVSWPAISVLAFAYSVAAWSLLTGVLELVTAIRLRREIPGELMLGIAGCLSIAFGAILAAWPRTGAFVLVALLGCYALGFGTAILTLALRLRRLWFDQNAYHRASHRTA